MRSFFLLLALLSAPAFLRAQAPVHAIAYTFSYDTTTPCLLVTVRFRGDASGKTVLLLPDAFASQKDLYKAVTHLESATPGVEIGAADTASRRILRHKPGAEITLRYELRQDWNVKFIYPYNYRAVLQPGWMHLTGYALFVKPDWPRQDRIRLSLNSKAMPARWKIANSFSAGNRIYTGTCTVNDLENSLHIGGDFRLYQRRLHGQSIYTAIRGNEWTFADSVLVKQAVRIIGGERDFWKDHQEPYFLLSLIPFEESGHYNGSALYHSFFMGMSPDAFAATQIHMLLAHEYMHHWIGGKLLLRGKEEEQYWFSEGFTEYYTYKTLHRNGIIGLPEYLGAINRTLSEYYLSPVRNATQKAAGDSFWLRGPYQRLPYTKGFTFAMYFDAMIGQRSKGKHSLDDLVFTLLNYHRSGDSVSTREVLQLLGNYSGAATDSLYQAWIVEGRTIPALPLKVAGTYPLKEAQLGIFQLGFDPSLQKKGAPMVGVIEGSAAWQAGLRDGQLLQSYSFQFDNISQPVKIGVLENGKLREISYLPMHTERTAVPQYVIGNQ
jgi:predicted metalloprotease with PDZ domain